VPGAAHRFLDELQVERGNGAQVDHFGLDPSDASCPAAAMERDTVTP